MLRSVMIRLRVTPTEHRRLLQLAGAQGLTLSAYLRWVALAPAPNPTSRARPAGRRR